MTQEEKQLLLKDLCGRMPYRTEINLTDGTSGIITSIRTVPHGTFVTVYFNRDNAEDVSLEDIRPYLRPMSSITEEENKTIDNISNKGKGFEEDEDGWIRCDSIHTKWGVCPNGCAKLMDYLNSIHIDYRGLIPMGLAIEAPEDMYKTE